MVAAQKIFWRIFMKKQIQTGTATQNAEAETTDLL